MAPKRGAPTASIIGDAPATKADALRFLNAPIRKQFPEGLLQGTVTAVEDEWRVAEGSDEVSTAGPSPARARAPS